MKNNRKKLTVILLLAAFTASSSGCSLQEFFAKTGPEVVHADWQDEYRPDEYQLITDGGYSIIGAEDEMLFETTLPEGAGEDAALYSDDGTLISPMFDNGTNGDRIAGDGIYSCSPNIKNETGEGRTYYAQAGGRKTNEASITYVDEPAEAAVNDIDRINTMISEATDPYTDQNGYTTDPVNAYKEVIKKAEELKNQGEILEFEGDEKENNVAMKLKSGILYVYECAYEDSDNGGSSTPSVQIATFEPERSLITPDSGARKIDAAFECANFPSAYNYDNSQVSMDNIVRGFRSDSIILWHGHGGFTSRTGSYLIIGNSDVKPSAMDYVKESVVYVWRKNQKPALAITSKFIDKYCSDMSNSLVYIAACSSAKNGRLSASFLGKGASTFIGNSSTIEALFDVNLQNAFCAYLSENTGSADSPKYRNAYDALKTAMKKCGGNSKYTGKPILTGDINYKVDKTDHTQNSSPAPGSSGSSGSSSQINNGKIDLSTVYISMKKGEKAVISVDGMPSGYTIDDLLWKSDDKNVAAVGGKYSGGNPGGGAPSGGSSAGSGIEAAIQWAIAIANDDSHGYSQQNRQGPDYDCSSLVCNALKNTGFEIGGATYTGNMRAELCQHGFEWIPWSQIGSADNLIRGDILLNESAHTEIYIGDGKNVGAHSSYGNPQTGDQTGKEISVGSYWFDNWGGVLRYSAPAASKEPQASGEYTRDMLIEMIGEYARQHYSETQILPSFQVAQFMLESTNSSSPSGLSKLAEKYYNYYGMKAGSNYSGNTINFNTSEYTAAGEKYNTNAAFRAYTSFEEGMQGYYAFLGYNRYSNLRGVTDYKTVCRLIREDGWATDPQYTNSLISIIESSGLTRFDDLSGAGTSSSSGTTSGSAGSAAVSAGSGDQFIINGNGQGSTIIHFVTKDNKYNTSLSVVVR